MKLSAYAKRIGVCYQTAYNHFLSGQIDGAYQLPSGTIIVPEKNIDKKKEHNVIYARVSSSQNKSNLDAQVKRISDFCSASGIAVHEIVKECASGLNDNRPKLTKILSERVASSIIVEHKDRLTRFGFRYIEILYPECKIIVINRADEDKDDLMSDFISLVTSFCARIYGLRRSKRKTEEIIRDISND